MTDETPETPPTSAPGAAALEDMLALCRTMARTRVAQAVATDPAEDPDGHARHDADRQALKYLKATARLGEALAKLDGTRTIKIVVTRQELRPPPPPVVARMTPTAEMEEQSRRMYEAFMKTDALRRKLIEGGGIGEVLRADDYIETQDGALVPISEALKVYEAHVGAEGEGDAISDGSNAGK